MFPRKEIEFSHQTRPILVYDFTDALEVSADENFAILLVASVFPHPE